MIISLIVAVAANGVIGKDNTLPWHLPADMVYFKRVTMGKPIIMGRKTFDGIGKALPGRLNIIITREADFSAPGCLVAHSIGAALAMAEAAAEVLVIGGAKLFEQVMPCAQRIYLTEIHEDFAGDTYFQPLDPGIWRETQRTEYASDNDNRHAYGFVVLERIR